jgi:glutathione S-transferase
MYTVIGAAKNRTFRIIWMLEELGQPYQRNRAQPQSPEVTQHSVLGKLPVMVEDGEGISDSVAILTYLADKHGSLTAPAGTIARGKQDALTFQILDDLESLVWSAARHSFVLPEEKRVPAVKDTLKWEWAKNLKTLERRFQGPFVMGSEITVPDILLTHTLNWAYGAKFPIESDDMMAYAKRMRERDAYLRAVASEEA